MIVRLSVNADSMRPYGHASTQACSRKRATSRSASTSARVSRPATAPCRTFFASITSEPGTVATLHVVVFDSLIAVFREKHLPVVFTEFTYSPAAPLLVGELHPEHRPATPGAQTGRRAPRGGSRRQPAGGAAIVVRNLVRIVDVTLLPFLAVISMLVTARAQRPGDAA